MGKLPEDVVLIRVDKETWKEWCEFCEKEGYLASKWAGFRLKQYMKDHGWMDMNGNRAVDVVQEKSA